MAISLIVCIIGGLVYLLCAGGSSEKFLSVVAQLGKWSFIVGLAAFLFGK